MSPTKRGGRQQMEISRRQLVSLGATGTAGAIVGKVASAGSPAVASERMGGIHINVLTKGVKPDMAKGFPHHFTMTVYGPDNDLSGMGWGGAFDVKTQEDIANSQMLQCIYSVRGAVQGDVVKLDGLMLFSAPLGGQGLPVHFEGNLATGFLRLTTTMTDGPFTFEGTGAVARI